MSISSKNVIRKKILTLLKNQREEDRVLKSQVIQNKLFLQPEFKKSCTILFYASFDGEVETFSMMEQARKIGKGIALPIIIKEQKKLIPSYVQDLEENLDIGPYGIRHPKRESFDPLDLREIDLVIVPGIAFDRDNNRLGRGAGYYDRFLRDIPSDVPTFGLAFDFQMVDHLPRRKEHDVPVTGVIVN